jgi:hypothetical protein
MLEEKIVISDIVIDCIGSYESNYDIITTTTVASEIVNNLDHVHVYYKPMIFTEVTEHVNVLNEYLLLRQLKNNQNQTNTTGAQNLKEFNNTDG